MGLPQCGFGGFGGFGFTHLLACLLACCLCIAHNHIGNHIGQSQTQPLVINAFDGHPPLKIANNLIHSLMESNTNEPYSQSEEQHERLAKWRKMIGK